MAGDLREALERRKAWFFESQLRRLNLDTFRGIRPTSDDTRLPLISESTGLTGDPAAGPSVGIKDIDRVYLDSGESVWTEEDEELHGAFGGTLLGRVGDFLGAREPHRLAERLAALRTELEASASRSAHDPFPTLNGYPRDPPKITTSARARGDSRGVAISRAETAGRMPWLVPELFPLEGENTLETEGWVRSLEGYVASFETDLAVAIGGIAGVRPPYAGTSGDSSDGTPIGAAPAAYRAFVSMMLTASTTRPAGDYVRARFTEGIRLADNQEDKDFHYLSVATNGAAMGPVRDYPWSTRMKYWVGVYNDPLRECIGWKPNSDMGLCQLVRLLYRYGPLPASFGPTPAWRTRAVPDDTFTGFFNARAAACGDNHPLRDRLRTGEAKLRVILEETASQPRAPDTSWSPIAGEILKQGLQSYKFWLDEQPRALDNDRVNKVKRDLGYGDENDREMEFWSENHYIMFASSEYLLGQLWLDDAFQPGRVIPGAPVAESVKSGEQRRRRGRARCLKWLNNRLMFGWMEFNSSGYYREHLWALLNLVDFAKDEEVRTKATMAVDLMLFDVLRFSHRGSMGAAGGRSQFKSKSHGFDNGLTDVTEMLLGVKGVFAEGSSEIGASFATSTYEVPQVLLEIGSHPPAYPFTDRARVSVTFDEAAKYGIAYSQKSVTKDSLLRGYAVKRALHQPHLDEVNREIARTHEDYGRMEDDTVFFWGMSAFFNKQVVRNTLRLVHQFGLEKAEAFGMVRTLIEYVLRYTKATDFALPGGPGDLLGPVTDLVSGDGGDRVAEIDEDTADDLSVVLEGSTRTRANILTYRSPGAMQSSAQNFRPGQLNFQSSLQQATLSGALNVFVTAGFEGLDISDLVVFLGGAAVGGVVFGPLGAVAGGIAAVALEDEYLEGTNPLGRLDGPDWWTGYWATPRIAAHRGAVIMLSEFHAVQDFLAECGSHAWFPQEGFDRVVERRTSAYDDADFALLDIGHIGPKGFWVFGMVRHPTPGGTTGEPEEGYVGVFSNQRPEWLSKDDDPYPKRLEEEEKEELMEGRPDPFAGRDWYVNGKNVWIVQVGSRSEYGSFEAFMDRVSSARVHLDDTGDLECTYDVPRPEGGADRLRVTNTDDPEFELNGHPLAIDLYPRFENPFVRSGRVEWGQPGYCLEWNGHSLLHDLRDYRTPVRVDEPRLLAGAADEIIALVVFLRTGEEAMEPFTTALATVDIGGERVVTYQTAAVGPVSEETDHDAEWLHLAGPVERSPDMTLSLLHPAAGGNPLDLSFPDPDALAGMDPWDLLTEGVPDLLAAPFEAIGELLDSGDDPEWKARFTLKALMGDWTLKECSVPFGGINVEDDRRDSGPRPFAVRVGRWATWQRVAGGVESRRWLLARQPSASAVWLEHHDLFVVDDAGRLWHKRAKAAMTQGAWYEDDGAGAVPDWRRLVSWAASSDMTGRTLLFAVDPAGLHVRVSDQTGRWTEPWSDPAPLTDGAGILPAPVPLGSSTTITVVPVDNSFSGIVDLHLTGSDGEVYVNAGWSPGADARPWLRLETVDLTLAPASPLAVVGGYVVASSVDGTLWGRHRDRVVLMAGGWENLGGPGFVVSRFDAGGVAGDLLLAASGPAGQVSLGRRPGADPVVWVPTRTDDAWRPRPRADLGWVTTDPGVHAVYVPGLDGTVRCATYADPVWRPVGRGTPPAGAPASRVAVTCRVPGQVEVFTDTVDRSLSWTWWS
ncbi:hypothetical protein [Nocardioides sp. zg-1228]|uniref:hypothetical protein n=1 Tax=Nocardioides sp. zg-1228 TaxID=2763008 RepID=UPI001642F0BB|nr:hypothetical protein [Nocardioides sp. zg-1228]MBC2932947.1 hypothetical protein [Nocardioides sp. zg-1228]QSF56851.1 hypothetical protein JX575_14790 [Nocardioides sp. zg-1228]